MKIEEGFSIGVENMVGKGEIARYEQFLLFPQCFQKDLSRRHVKTRACSGKGYTRLKFYHFGKGLSFLISNTLENYSNT